MNRLIEGFGLRLTSQLVNAIESDLRRNHREPRAEVVAAKTPQPSQIVFEQQEPRVADDVVNFVGGQWPLDVADLAHRLA
jgi:hypothetical protein